MRIFAALDVNKEIQNYLNNIYKQLNATNIDLKPVTSYHITLKFFGKTDQIENIKASLSRINFSPFTIKTYGIGYFSKGKDIKVIWAGVKPSTKIKKLHKDIESTLANTTIKMDKKYNPHITIARVKSQQKKQKELIEKIKNVEKKEIESKITSIALYKSTLTSQGPIYQLIKRFKPVR
ncbi:MAG: RNA 2',3'-cyclic phosphodiesterase [Nanobdellota archaeon]